MEIFEFMVYTGERLIITANTLYNGLSTELPSYVPIIGGVSLFDIGLFSVGLLFVGIIIYRFASPI